MDRIDIKVLNKDFQLIKVEDSFKSLMWCKRYNEVGALDLELSATRENLEIYKEGNYIVRDDDDAVYRIQAAELETTADKNNNLIIGATDVKDILNQRVHYMEEALYDTVENFIRDLIERNIISPSVLTRQIPNFVLGERRGYDDTLLYQLEYDNVGEIISELCKTYQYGYRVLLNENTFVFDLYKGVNRTQFNNVVPPVTFSSSYGNLLSSKYTKDLTKYKNVAVVTGKFKNGDEEETRLFEVGAAQGLNRYETHVNSSGSSKDLTEKQFTDALAEKGKEALAKIKSTESFEAEISLNQFKYKTDFNLGDIVTVENEFGIYSDARIIEIIETWEDGKYSIEPVFEFGEPVDTYETSGAIVAEQGPVLMTTRNAVMTVEQSEEVQRSVKISELDMATSLSEGCCFPVVQGDETRRVTFGMVEDELGIDEINNKVDSLNVDVNGVKDNIDEIEELLLELSESGNIIIDSALSSTSTNPVQNKVINSSLSTINTNISDINTSLNGVKSNLYWKTKVWVDVSGSSYDVNKWYPVTGTAMKVGDGLQDIKVSVALNSGKVPSWSTHKNGFSVDLHVQDIANGWGTSQKHTLILADTTTWTTNTISPASYSQMTNSNTPVLFLRGGGRYYISTSFTCTWTPRTSTYTISEQSVSPVTSRPTPMGIDISEPPPPINFIYVQYRGQDAPATLFPGTTWTNVSSTYAGRFFRVEGGSAAAFGSQQAGGLPNITGTISSFQANYNYRGSNVSGAFYNSISENGKTDSGGGSDTCITTGFSASRSSSLYGAASEVRPINETKRIWKRTG